MDTNDSDKIFREKLGKYAAEPGPHVWERVRHTLDKKQRKRLVPLWWPLGGAVAVLLLGLWLSGTFSGPEQGGVPISETEKSPTGNPADTQSLTGTQPGAGAASEKESHSDPRAGESQIPDGSIATPTKSIPRPSGAAGDPGQNAGPINPASGKQGLDGNGVLVTSRPETGGMAVEPENEPRTTEADLDAPAASLADVSGKANSRTGEPGANRQETVMGETLAVNDGKKSLFEELEEKEAPEEPEPKKGRWAVGPSVAPVYYNSFGNGSPIASNFMANSKSGTVNLSYGLSVSYAMTNRLSLRSGIHKVDLGYNTNQVSFTSTLAVRPSSLIRTISYSENSKNVVVHSTASPSGQNAADGAAPDITAPSPEREGRMLQQFGYLEVPVELQYNLVDRKLGLNLIGGMSSMFLIANSVSLDSQGSSTEIGEASNLNAVNFSTNFGVGVYYRLNPRLQLQLQPMVKLHLNTFSETSGSFRPYTVGVYSGLSFRF